MKSLEKTNVSFPTTTKSRNIKKQPRRRGRTKIKKDLGVLVVVVVVVVVVVIVIMAISLFPAVGQQHQNLGMGAK